MDSLPQSTVGQLDMLLLLGGYQQGIHPGAAALRRTRLDIPGLSCSCVCSRFHARISVLGPQPLAPPLPGILFLPPRTCNRAAPSGQGPPSHRCSRARSTASFAPPSRLVEVGRTWTIGVDIRDASPTGHGCEPPPSQPLYGTPHLGPAWTTVRGPRGWSNGERSHAKSKIAIRRSISRCA
eukprot:scaffold207_cov345-Pavlova_lutheri.AAC.16